MNNRFSPLIRLLCGGALVMAVLICYPGSWEQRAGAGSKTAGRLAERVMGASYQLEVGGKALGIFNACSGIGSAHEVIETKAATKDGKQLIQKIPGRLKWSDVTLSRPLTADNELYAWRQQVIEGRVAEARKTCTVTMVDMSGKPLVVWELSNAWPVSLVAIQKAAAEPMIEEMAIAYESAIRKP